MQSMGREKISALLISPHFRALLICHPSFYMTRLNVLYASNVDVWYRPNLTLIAQCALPDPIWLTHEFTSPMCSPNVAMYGSNVLSMTQCAHPMLQCTGPRNFLCPNVLTPYGNVPAHYALPEALCKPNALTQCVNVLAQYALPDPMCSPNVTMYIAWPYIATWGVGVRVCNISPQYVGGKDW